MWLHAIGSQRTRRIYRLITENVEIEHSSERVVLHLYSCWSVGPRRPSDQSDAFVAGFLYMFVSSYLYFYVSS